MIYYASISPTGQINGVNYTNNEDPRYIPEGHVILDEKDCENILLAHETHYYEQSKLVRIPERPSQYHYFDFSVKEWFLHPTKAWESIRTKRNELLRETDWMVTRAIELGEPMPSGWVSYRQGLRDITEQSDPLTLVWPVKPA